jgi:drug/metabolite transporter (DMT)-like permease
MHLYGAAKATVQNFAVNYILTMILAALIFNEEALTLRKLGGVSLILVGIAVISSGSQELQTRYKLMGAETTEGGNHS